MPKFYGINPGPATRETVEAFENDVVIRHKNRQLVGSVYVDLHDASWAVAFAYNYSRHPGLHGHENALEARYSYRPGAGSPVMVFRSDPYTETVLETGQFADPDSFIRHIVSRERRFLNRPA